MASYDIKLLDRLTKFNEIKIDYKRPKDIIINISDSKTAYEIFKSIFDYDLDYIEKTAVIMLNRRNNLLGYKIIGTGGFSGAIIDGKIILNMLSAFPLSSLILAHTHPSGNKIPSESDKNLTRKLASGFNFFDIQLLDHLIITSESYLSFADEGLL